MRLSLHEWRKQVTYFKRNNFKNIQKVRGVVNTCAFFIVWGYAGYYIARQAEKSLKETGIPHNIQVARLAGERYVTKWDLSTGQTELIDVDQVLAEKELEVREKVLEQRRLREEAQNATS